MPRPSRRTTRSWSLRAAASAAVAASLFSALPGADAGDDWWGDPGVPADPLEVLKDLSDYFLDPRAPSPDSWGASATVVEAGTTVRVAAGPMPLTVRAAAPAGTVVSVEVRRVTGGLPDVLWAQDASGRAWTPATARDGRTLVVEDVALSVEGGLDLVLVPTRTARCVADVTVTARPLEGEAPAVESPWAAGRVVVTPPEGGACTPVGDLGLPLLEERDGYVVLGLPPGRTGLEWTDAAYLASLCPEGFGFEPDAYAEPPEGSQTNQAIVGSEFGRQYPIQPGLRMIFAPPRTRGIDGSGTVIAVLDTGVDATHPRLLGRVLPGLDLVDGDEDASETDNGLDDDGDGNPDDGFGHGTIVAGVALAVAPGAKVLPVRVLDDEGLGTASRIAAGVRWAVDRGAHVINLSLGTRAWSSVLAEAIAEATTQGVIVVVAAGNDGDRWSVDFPAAVPGVIPVSALGIRGRPAGFSNGRRAGTIYAPGVRVIGPWPGGLWAQATGTSFAAPFASGAAALLRQQSPGANAALFRARLAPHLRLDLRALWQ